MTEPTHREILAAVKGIEAVISERRGETDRYYQANRDDHQSLKDTLIDHGKRLRKVEDVANIGKGAAGGGGSASDPNATTGLGREVTLDDLPSQMIDINSATRVYKANVAVLKRYEQMMETTLELLR